MTRLAPEAALLTFGTKTVIAGEELPLLPDVIEHHSKIGSFVVAQRIDDAGNIRMLQPPVPCNEYPDPPSAEEKATDPTAEHRYVEACAAYIAATKRERPPRPVPPFLGRLVLSPRRTNFLLNNEQTNVPWVVSYPDEAYPALFHLRHATIVE